MILAGQKNAKKRVFLFFFVFFVTGFISELFYIKIQFDIMCFLISVSVFGIFTFNIFMLKHHNNHTARIFIFISLIFEVYILHYNYSHIFKIHFIM